MMDLALKPVFTIYFNASNRLILVEAMGYQKHSEHRNEFVFS